jgi:hypothetical protein
MPRKLPAKLHPWLLKRIENPINVTFPSSDPAHSAKKGLTGKWIALSDYDLLELIESFTASYDDSPGDLSFLCGYEIKIGGRSYVSDWSVDPAPLKELFADMPSLFIWNSSESSHTIDPEAFAKALEISVDKLTAQQLNVLYSIIFYRLKRSNVNVSSMVSPVFDIPDPTKSPSLVSTLISEPIADPSTEDCKLFLEHICERLYAAGVNSGRIGCHAKNWKRDYKKIINDKITRGFSNENGFGMKAVLVEDDGRLVLTELTANDKDFIGSVFVNKPLPSTDFV